MKTATKLFTLSILLVGMSAAANAATTKPAAKPAPAPALTCPTGETIKKQITEQLHQKFSQTYLPYEKTTTLTLQTNSDKSTLTTEVTCNNGINPQGCSAGTPEGQKQSQHGMHISAPTKENNTCNYIVSNYNPYGLANEVFYAGFVPGETTLTLNNSNPPPAVQLTVTYNPAPPATKSQSPAK